MNRRPWQRRGIEQVTRGLGTLDRELFDAIAERPTRFRMDDGLIDVRILEAGRRLATTRILTALALGRLQRSPLYHEMQVPEFSFLVVDGPTCIALDGEVGEDYDRASFTAKYRILPVFRPLG